MNEDTKWRIVIDLTYIDKDTCIKEFERVYEAMKARNWARGFSGSSGNFYGVKGPLAEQLSDDEIIKLRELIK